MEDKKRLIDINPIIRDLTAMKSMMYDATLLDAIIKALENAPTVDAVEVVRCEDCKHEWIHPCGYIHCRMSCRVDHDMTFSPEDFCSYGEMRDYNADD